MPKPGDTALGDFAADLGNFLGGVQNRASSWMDQHRNIVDQLTTIRDTANEYLQQITGAGATMAVAMRKARRGRPPGSGAKRVPATKTAAGVAKGGGRRKGFKMSPEAKARIAEAQKQRWAKYRQEKGEGNKHRGETSAASKTVLSKRIRRGGARKMSAAARKRISDAQKKRWAKVRAGKGKAA